LTKDELANLWQFPWPIMDVLIGGKSSIDLTELRIKSHDEAEAFLRAYGYDATNPVELRQITAAKEEALAFIEQQLLNPKEWQRGIKPPDEIINCEDPCLLLLWASNCDPSDRWRSHWACALLRVMHTIAHLEGVHRTIDMQAARAQIFSRFQEYLKQDDDGKLWFGSPNARCELAAVEWKEVKSRNSIILKLLHKRDNVAETIYDYVGIRFITKNLSDVMLAVKLLHEHNIIVYPNAYPSRARNNLIDAQSFQTEIDGLRQKLLAGNLSAEAFRDALTQMSIEAPVVAATTSNPHSSTSYRAIQMTGRQLIKIPSAKLEWLFKLSQGQPSGEPKLTSLITTVRDMVKHLPTAKDHRYDSAFFPFEVQILDLAAHQQAQSGDANHDRYKSSQVRAARKRVLAQVLETAKSSPG